MAFFNLDFTVLAFLKTIYSFIKLSEFILSHFLRISTFGTIWSKPAAPG